MTELNAPSRPASPQWAPSSPAPPRLACTLALGALVLCACAVGAAAQQRDHEGNVMTADGQYVHTNALFFEPSPYLAQHAHNPVQWLPWGEEAFKKAREENKPIFLSIGYSTCHWCHVMARESFSDDEVAAVLNDLYVPVKVDREERPDVDDVYMTAAHVMGRRGGWPLSVWLTPELEPFDTGTYFPKNIFMGKLMDLAGAWQGSPPMVRQQAGRVAAAVRQRLSQRRAAGEAGEALMDGAVARLGSGFDATHGGWGVPKFPRESTLLFLLDNWQVEGDARALELALGALDGMAGGGIHDQVGGGFHRYSVDGQWLVPHFEKMLYNQAWLGRAYLEAYRLTGEPRYRETVERLLGYVERDMTGPHGAFHSAEDADSDGEEGLFYIWRPAEIQAALGEKDAALALEWFGVTASGNFREQPGASILTARGDADDFARRHDMTREALASRLAGWNETLVAARALRVRPHLDDKVLTDWNGFIIGTFARAGAVLDEPRHVETAQRAARFLLSSAVDDHGRLLHGWRGRALDVPAFVDDHAALIDALIELYDATGKSAWIDEATRLHATMREQFRAEEDGAFTRTGPGHERLLARSKEGHDGAVPSGNALVAWDAVRLWRRTGDDRYEQDAEGIFRAFAGELRAASGAAFMLRALQAWIHGEAGWSARDEFGVACVRGPAGPVALRAGEETRVVLDLQVKKGWHVGAAKPGGAVRPTTVSVAAPARLVAADLPKGQDTTLPFLEERARLYVGGEKLALRVATQAPPGPTVLRVDVALQACDDSKCLAPRTLRVEIPVVVTAAPAGASSTETSD